MRRFLTLHYKDKNITITVFHITLWPRKIWSARHHVHNLRKSYNTSQPGPPPPTHRAWAMAKIWQEYC